MTSTQIAPQTQEQRPSRRARVADGALARQLPPPGGRGACGGAGAGARARVPVGMSYRELNERVALPAAPRRSGTRRCSALSATRP